MYGKYVLAVIQLFRLRLHSGPSAERKGAFYMGSTWGVAPGWYMSRRWRWVWLGSWQACFLHPFSLRAGSEAVPFR